MALQRARLGLGAGLLGLLLEDATAQNLATSAHESPALLFVDGHYSGDGPLVMLMVLFTAALVIGGGVFCCAVSAQHGRGSVREFFLVELLDALFDVISLVLTSAEGDLVFYNDPGGHVHSALLISVSLSVLLVCAEGGIYQSGSCSTSEFKNLLVCLYCLHVVFEDLFQAFVYSWVASTQVRRSSC